MKIFFLLQSYWYKKILNQKSLEKRLIYIIHYVFYEPFLHIAFKIIFLSYMYGQILGYILTVITNYLRSSEETVIAPVH